MPLFTVEEYEDFGSRPGMDEAWDRLPIVKRIGGIGLRWLGPLVELGHDRWMGDLADAAYGHLESCGWQHALDQGGAMLDARGRVRPQWAAAFCDAATRLAEGGSYAGPEGDASRWAAWMAFEFSEPHQWLSAAAAKRGWDR
jgi:hypothetical protein